MSVCVSNSMFFVTGLQDGNELSGDDDDNDEEAQEKGTASNLDIHLSL